MKNVNRRFLKLLAKALIWSSILGIATSYGYSQYQQQLEVQQAQEQVVIELHHAVDLSKEAVTLSNQLLADMRLAHSQYVVETQH